MPPALGRAIRSRSRAPIDSLRHAAFQLPCERVDKAVSERVFTTFGGRDEFVKALKQLFRLCLQILQLEEATNFMEASI